MGPMAHRNRAALLNARYQLDSTELNRSRLKAFLALAAP